MKANHGHTCFILTGEETICIDCFYPMYVRAKEAERERLQGRSGHSGSGRETQRVALRETERSSGRSRNMSQGSFISLDHVKKPYAED
jgi:hypothetical protein